jgi:hypothetical protein
MLESLPGRPLARDEAEQLKEQDGRIVPLSILTGEESQFVVYTLAFYLHERERIHLLGYSDEEGAWVEFESFDEADWTVDAQETAVQNWVDAQYGDEYEQGMLDEESGTVDVGFE